MTLVDVQLCVWLYFCTFLLAGIFTQTAFSLPTVTGSSACTLICPSLSTGTIAEPTFSQSSNIDSSGLLSSQSLNTATTCTWVCSSSLASTGTRTIQSLGPSTSGSFSGSTLSDKSATSLTNSQVTASKSNRFLTETTAIKLSTGQSSLPRATKTETDTTATKPLADQSTSRGNTNTKTDTVTATQQSQTYPSAAVTAVSQSLSSGTVNTRSDSSTSRLTGTATHDNGAPNTKSSHFSRTSQLSQLSHSSQSSHSSQNTQPGSVTVNSISTSSTARGSTSSSINDAKKTPKPTSTPTPGAANTQTGPSATAASITKTKADFVGLQLTVTNLNPSGTQAAVDIHSLGDYISSVASEAKTNTDILVAGAVKTNLLNDLDNIESNLTGLFVALGGVKVNDDIGSQCSSSGIFGLLKKIACVIKSATNLSTKVDADMPKAVDVEAAAVELADAETALEKEQQEEEDDEEEEEEEEKEERSASEEEEKRTATKEEDKHTSQNQQSTQKKGSTQVETSTQQEKPTTQKSTAVSKASVVSSDLSSQKPNSASKTIAITSGLSTQKTSSASRTTAVSSGPPTMYAIFPTATDQAQTEAEASAVSEQLGKVANAVLISTLDYTDADNNYHFFLSAKMDSAGAQRFTAANHDYVAQRTCGSECVDIDLSNNPVPSRKKRRRESRYDSQQYSEAGLWDRDYISDLWNTSSQPEKRALEKRDPNAQIRNVPNELVFLSGIFFDSFDGIPKNYYFDTVESKGTLYILTFGGAINNLKAFKSSPAPYSQVEVLFADTGQEVETNRNVNYGDPVGTCLLDKARGRLNGVAKFAHVTMVQLGAEAPDINLVEGLRTILRDIDGQHMAKSRPKTVVIPFNVDINIRGNFDNTDTMNPGDLARLFFPHAIKGMLTRLEDEGAVVIVTGGSTDTSNGELQEGFPAGVPASIPKDETNVITVGPLTQQGDYVQAWGVNKRDLIDVWAIGEGITCVTGAAPSEKQSGTGYAAAMVGALAHYLQSVPNGPTGTAAKNYQDTQVNVKERVIDLMYSRGTVNGEGLVELPKAFYNGIWDDARCQHPGKRKRQLDDDLSPDIQTADFCATKSSLLAAEKSPAGGFPLPLLPGLLGGGDRGGGGSDTSITHTGPTTAVTGSPTSTKVVINNGGLHNAGNQPSAASTLLWASVISVSCFADGAPWMEPTAYCDCGHGITLSTMPLPTVAAATTTKCPKGLVNLASTIHPVSTASRPPNPVNCAYYIATAQGYPTGTENYCFCDGNLAPLITYTTSGTTTSDCKSYSTKPTAGWTPTISAGYVPPPKPTTTAPDASKASTEARCFNGDGDNIVAHMDIDDLTLYCEGDLTDYNFLNTNEGVSIEQKVIKAGYSFNKLILSADCQSMPEKSRDAVAANLCAAPLTKIVTQCPNSGGGIFNACGYWWLQTCDVGGSCSSGSDDPSPPLIDS